MFNYCTIVDDLEEFRFQYKKEDDEEGQEYVFKLEDCQMLEEHDLFKLAASQQIKELNLDLMGVNSIINEGDQ